MIRTLARALTTAIFAACAVVAVQTPALACVLDEYGNCYTPKVYRVSGTDGTLAVQSQPAQNHYVGSLAEGANVTVLCQMNYGAAVDGKPSHTWDKISFNGQIRWVFDWYVTTPTQDANGWSPNVPHCGEGSPLQRAGYALDALGAQEWVDDGHGYFGGECVSFAAWAVRSDRIANTRSPDWHGNGNSWESFAAIVPASGVRVGDIAHWEANVHGAGALGHVAYVAKVNSTTVVIYEYNWGATHRPGTRTIDKANGANSPTRFLRF